MNVSFLGVALGEPGYVPQTGWLRHGPFATWLVKAARPACIVELGTHHGYSYFSFCQSVVEAGLATRCIAVDTWHGDEHAGFYGDDVFVAVESENQKYLSFSSLLRKSFAEALNDIEDGSVDLLHVDGRHFYEDVKQDFEAWIPKLSHRAIVLFHDTEVRERGFGVYRFWEELSDRFPSVNFRHEHGLGVLLWGSDFTSELRQFHDLIADKISRNVVSDFFHCAGENYVHKREMEKLRDRLSSPVISERMSEPEAESGHAEGGFNAIPSSRTRQQHDSDGWWSRLVAVVEYVDYVNHLQLSRFSWLGKAFQNKFRDAARRRHKPTYGPRPGSGDRAD